MRRASLRGSVAACKLALPLSTCWTTTEGPTNALWLRVTRLRLLWVRPLAAKACSTRTGRRLGRTIGIAGLIATYAALMLAAKPLAPEKRCTIWSSRSMLTVPHTASAIASLANNDGSGDVTASYARHRKAPFSLTHWRGGARAHTHAAPSRSLHL